MEVTRKPYQDMPSWTFKTTEILVITSTGTNARAQDFYFLNRLQ